MISSLAEHERIVVRVDELISHATDLEAKLKQQQTDANHLTEALIAGVLGRVRNVSLGDRLHVRCEPLRFPRPYGR